MHSDRCCTVKYIQQSHGKFKYIREQQGFPQNGKTRLEMDARGGFDGDLNADNYGMEFNKRLRDNKAYGILNQNIDEVYVIIDDNTILKGLKDPISSEMDWTYILYGQG